MEKDNQLIVQTRLRSLIGMFIFGLIFALAGLAAFWFFGRSAEATCTRLEVREVRCEIKETLLGMVVRLKTAINPSEVQVQVNEDSDGDTYRVAFVTAQGVVPLTEAWSGDGVFAQTEAQLNQFLQNPSAKTINVAQPPSPWIYLFPLCFGGVGVFAILALSFETYIFDRDRAALLIKRESLRGAKVTEEPLAGLKFSVRDHSDSDSTSYRVHVLTGTGRDLTIGDYRTQRGAQQLAQRIEDFIKPGVHIRYVDVEN
ncbi:MAG TPA: hypothetical protein VMP08_00290 [Anaerolineae bacterium]|nr:hypothetical protein [Anaerolineae bacterium]